MTQRVRGNIPEKLTVFRFESETYEQRWAQQGLFSEESQESLAKFEARRCFYYPSTSAKAIETFEERKATLRYEKETVDNKIITELQLISAQSVKWGSRTLALINAAEVTELDQDAILDILLNSECKNGKIVGEFQFCLVGNNLKLLRVDSALYKELAETQRRTELNVRATKLVVGGVYETPVDGKYVYLGKVDQDWVSDETQVRYGNYNYTSRGYSGATYTWKFSKNQERNKRAWISLEQLERMEKGYTDYRGCVSYPAGAIETPRRLKVSYLVETIDVSGVFDMVRDRICKNIAGLSIAKKPSNDDETHQQLYRLASYGHAYLTRPAGQDLKPLLDCPELKPLFDQVQW